MSGAAASGALLSGAAGWAFLVFAVLAVAAGIAVVVAKNPVHSALFLLACFLMVACIFILQKAEFVGAVQILVYAGGVMVLFLFVIMLVHQRTIRTARTFHHQWDIALILLAASLVLFFYILGTETFSVVPGRPEALRSAGGLLLGNTEAVSWLLFRDYLLPFEVASVLLLVAMIGAVVLGRRSAEKMD